MDMFKLVEELRARGVKSCKLSKPEGKRGYTIDGEVEFYPVTTEERNAAVVASMDAHKIAFLESLKDEQRDKFLERERLELLYGSA